MKRFMVAWFLWVITAFLALITPVHSQTIQTDPFIKEAISGKNFEPGGKNFPFSDRGTIVKKSGGFTITPTYHQRVGNYSLQGARLGGTYNYTNDLDDHHPIEVHGAFSNDATNSVSARQEQQGTQSSYQYTWRGNENHPSNAYDGSGGAGARDEYSFSITDGIATGIYLLPQSELQRLDRPRIEYAKNAISGGIDRILLKDATHGNNLGEKLIESGSDVIIGVNEATIGALMSLATPELQSGVMFAQNAYVNKFYRPLDVQAQYAFLAGGVKIGQFVDDHPIIAKSLEAGASVWGVGQVAKGVKSGVKAEKALETINRADNVANYSKLKSQLTAEQIANGHAFDKHVINQNEFPNILTKKQFSKHIENIINNPTDYKTLSNGRSAYWDDVSETVIIYNPKSSDGGTAFKPKDGKVYFNKLK